ncbi:unnamed protein product [Leuciscus chuanchicus]
MNSSSGRDQSPVEKPELQKHKQVKQKVIQFETQITFLDLKSSDMLNTPFPLEIWLLTLLGNLSTRRLFTAGRWRRVRRLLSSARNEHQHEQFVEFAHTHTHTHTHLLYGSSEQGFSAKLDREMRSIRRSFSPVPSLLWVPTVTQNCLLGRRWFWVLFPLRFGVQRSPALIAPGPGAGREGSRIPERLTAV